MRDVLQAIGGHFARAYTRLVPPKKVRVGDVFVRIDRRAMPNSLIRAILRGDYELPERNAVARMVRPGDRVAEFGGGVGVVSMTAAKIAGPGNVHVYEPLPAACDLILQNARLNELEIECSNAAVASKSGTRTFWATSNIVSSNFFGGRKDGKGQTTAVEVELVAVDDILSARQPNVIIIDIEGAEVEVLGACNLAGVEVIVIELHPHVVGEEAIAALQTHLREQGFATVPSLEDARTQVFTRGRQPAY
jgi:FkbM family methyltransferase